MSDTSTFESDLTTLGFVLQGASRSGGRMWTLVFNRFLTFTLHDYDEAAVLTWSFALGDYLVERNWRVGVTDTSTAELYPSHDVRIPLDAHAVRGEVTRVLGTLRLDLGDPTL